MTPSTSYDERYLAVLRKDRARDGEFFFAVTTTHVFCLPSCPCRAPRPEHVEYYQTAAAAMQAGFRPCKRCRPLGSDAATVLSEVVIETRLGPMMAVGCLQGLTLLEFTDRPMLKTQRERARNLFGSEIVQQHFPAAATTERQLAEYFDGSRRRFDVPLLPLGTPFQRAVWGALVRIPFGYTSSYERLAADLGRVGAQRAVGRANGDNRISIIIPCHRVIGSDGDLTGYGGGLWRKRALLELEGVIAPSLVA